MKTKTGVIAASLSLLVAACASDPRNVNQMAFEDALSFNDQSAERLAEARSAMAEMNNEDIRSLLNVALNDVTAIIKQRGHGIYVEYTDPDGRVYMWYPQNLSVVLGTWGISNAFSPPRACFSYMNAHHGVTGEFEPTECVETEQTLGGAYVIDRRGGDVFQLSTKGIPYIKSTGNLPPWPEDWEKFDRQ